MYVLRFLYLYYYCIPGNFQTLKLSLIVKNDTKNCNTINIY